LPETALLSPLFPMVRSWCVEDFSFLIPLDWTKTWPNHLAAGSARLASVSLLFPPADLPGESISTLFSLRFTKFDRAPGPRRDWYFYLRESGSPFIACLTKPVLNLEFFGNDFSSRSSFGDRWTDGVLFCQLADVIVCPVPSR